MSNHSAIATVTATLQRILQDAIGNAGINATVGFSRPDASNSKVALINVFLYQVTHNAAYRNADLPTRRPDGALVDRPRAALDLHYLFTFHGDEDKFEPQRLLGVAASALNSKPFLSPQDITKVQQQYLFLAGSGLESQVERVRFTPTALSLEEFSKLWSVFFQVEYTLSAAYQASVVLIESDELAQEALPVQARNLYLMPFRWPRIDRVINQAGGDLPIVALDTIQIQGRQLRGDTTFVLLEGQEWPPDSVSESEIVFTLPPGIHAGVQSLQVVQRRLMGTPLAVHRGVESNAAAFVLRPTIIGAKASLAAPGCDVLLTLAPNIGPGQRAVLVLNQTTGVTPASFVSTPVISALDSNQITVNMIGVPPGDYLARVQVDGAESLLTMSGGQFTGFTVTML